jgi:hypothetical protein
MAAEPQNNQPACYPPAGYQPRPSVIGDLIRNHRDQMRVIWDRHVREMREQNPKQVRAA